MNLNTRARQYCWVRRMEAINVTKIKVGWKDSAPSRMTRRLLTWAEGETERLSMKRERYNFSYLKQTISHQCNQQLVSMFLPDQGGVFWGVHAGEVKHGYIRLSVVVDGVVQGWQLVVCAKISRFTSIWEQSFLIDVVRTQKPFSFHVILH